MTTQLKSKKPWYKRIWLWIGVVIVVAAIGSMNMPKQQPSAAAPSPTSATLTPTSTDKPATQWDYETAYNAIKNGMSKPQVEQAAGKSSESCTESEIAQLGKSELCTYGNAFTDKAVITVTYRNNAVDSKTKSTY